METMSWFHEEPLKERWQEKVMGKERKCSIAEYNIKVYTKMC
jgi:hypothetical protein